MVSHSVFWTSDVLGALQFRRAALMLGNSYLDAPLPALSGDAASLSRALRSKWKR